MGAQLIGGGLGTYGTSGPMTLSSSGGGTAASWSPVQSEHKMEYLVCVGIITYNSKRKHYETCERHAYIIQKMCKSKSCKSLTSTPAIYGFLH